MTRAAWAVTIAVLIACGPSLARAFKAGSDFGKPAASGGGGGILFTGAPAYKRWTCAACHTGTPGKIRLRMTSAPADLVNQRRYQPGAAYQITVGLDGEHRGFDAALNTNGMAVTFTDGAGAPAGRMTGFDNNELVSGVREAELVSSGLLAGRTSWTFTWNAPAAGTGRVTAFVAAVDGDGASTTERRTSDPWNDDLATGSIALEER